jgi:hypothetical protein
MKGILGYTDEKVVSTDCGRHGDPAERQGDLEPIPGVPKDDRSRRCRRDRDERHVRQAGRREHTGLASAPRSLRTVDREGDRPTPFDPAYQRAKAAAPASARRASSRGDPERGEHAGLKLPIGRVADEDGEARRPHTKEAHLVSMPEGVRGGLRQPTSIDEGNVPGPSPQT